MWFETAFQLSGLRLTSANAHTVNGPTTANALQPDLDATMVNGVPDARGDLLQKRFAAAAARVVRERAGVDLDTARELMLEVATMLHNSLALDGLDDHDHTEVVDDLARDLTSPDPAAAVSQRVTTAAGDSSRFHDPAAVAAACTSVGAVLRL